MTSWIVNLIIDKFLKDILEVDSNVTDANLLKQGQIELGNVKINQKFLKNLNMPFFEFVDSQIGKFTAKLYFSIMRMDYHFENHPIYIILDEVFLLVRQKGMSDWSEEQKIKEMEIFKQYKLKELEEVYSQYLMQMADKQESDFMKKIIHNLNISITNIVIRFEDEISNPSNPYSLGLIISQFISKPTNSDFNEDIKDDIPFGDLNNKIVILKGLSVFMDIKKDGEDNSFKKLISKNQNNLNAIKKNYLKDSFDFCCYCLTELNEISKDKDAHNYLIFNLELNLKLRLNQNLKKNLQPNVFCDLGINSLNLKINILQIKSILKLLNVTKTYSIAQTGMEGSYYIKKLTDREKEFYTEIYIKFFEEKYFKKSKEEKYSAYTSQLVGIETQIKFGVIQAMRNAANLKLDFMKKLKDYDENIGQLKPGYFSYFTSQDSINKLKNLEENRNKLLDEQVLIDKLMEEEMKKTEILDKDPFEGMEKSYIKMDIKLSLKNFCFELFDEQTNDLLDINLKEFESHLLQGVNSTQAYLFLGDFYINQYKLKETVFNKIIESYNDNFQEEEIFGEEKQGNSFERYYENKKGALSIGFIWSPDMEPSNYKIRIRNTKRLYIYANLYSLKFIASLLGDALKSEINLSDVKKYATDEGYKHIQKGYEQVNTILTGEYQHFNIDADILIRGPRVVIPQNIIDINNKKCLLLSFGEFGLKSNLAPKKLPELNYKTITDDKKIYDKYEMKIYGFELITIDNFLGLQAIHEINQLNLIEKVDFDFIFFQIIEPKNEFRENFKIGMQFKQISLKIRDVQIKFLLYFSKYFTEMNIALDEELKKLSGSNNNDEVKNLEESIKINLEKDNPFNEENNQNKEEQEIKMKSI